MAVLGIVGEIGRFFEDALAAAVGLILMIIGLAPGVTMVVLPVGLASSLPGALIVGGLFTRFD